MEQYRTSIFEKSSVKTRKAFIQSLWFFGFIPLLWILYFIGFPLVGFNTAVTFSISILGFKLYHDKYMGISAYGYRKDTLIIALDHLVLRDATIFYTDLKNLVIYVEEYLGMPKAIYGVHHGGNNKIEFEYQGRKVSLNYIIKDKLDYDYVTRLVDKIEKDPALRPYLKELN